MESIKIANNNKTGSLIWILSLLGSRLPLYLGAIVISTLGLEIGRAHV